jgi:GTPase SAR1 family protein
VPKILVGTQIELRHDPETLHALAEQGKHPVTREQVFFLRTQTAFGVPRLTFPEAELVAREIKATAYMECSSRTGENLREVFEEAVRAVLVFQPDRSNRCTIS